MKTPSRNTLARTAMIVVIILGLVLAGFGLAQPDNPLYFAIGAGVISSLVASALFSFFGSRALGGQAELVDKLLQLEKATESRARYGATLLDEKYFHKPDYWNQLSAGTSKRLLLVGHALSTWLEPDYKLAFLTAIERVVRSNGDFCMILVDPSGTAHDRIVNARGRSYASAITSMLRALAELQEKLPERMRPRLDVRFLPADEQPLYMAVVTDSSVEYSPYFLRKSTKNSLHASFTISSAFATTVVSDFHALRSACTPVDLAEHRSANANR